MRIVMLWYQQDWGLFGRRYEMIARAWVEEHPGDEVLVVEPPMNPWIWVKNMWAAWRSQDRVLAGYWLRRLRNLAVPLTRENDRLWVWQPFLWWPARSAGNGAWTRFSFAVAWRMVERLLDRWGWKEAVLWAYPPHRFVSFAVERWRRGKICADLVDDNTQYETLSAALRADYRASYARVLDRASPVFAVSEALSRRYARPGKPVLAVPNAAPLDSGSRRPAALAPLPPGPRIGYVGRMDERMDLELLKTAVEDHPCFQFVFIGSMEPSLYKIWLEHFDPCPNVHRLGTVPHAYILSLLEAMDACVVPHRVTPLTDSMDPLKVYLYLAAGKPVVTTAVALDSRLAPWVTVADTPDQFSRALGRVLYKGGPKQRPDLQLQSWPERARLMADALAAGSGPVRNGAAARA